MDPIGGPHMPNTIANSIAVAAEWIATILGARAMRLIARFNKYVTNPLQRLWAPRLPYMAVIEHTGRKSGRSMVALSSTNAITGVRYGISGIAIGVSNVSLFASAGQRLANKLTLDTA